MIFDSCHRHASATPDKHERDSLQASSGLTIEKQKEEKKWRKGLTGGRLNKKDGLTRYGNSHVKDKTS